MPAPFRTKRMVEFADTDMAGIMHFSAFFRFMEGAEHALVRNVGLSVFGLKDSDGGDAVISFPRVSARCDFHSPARCEDVLEIEVIVQKLGTSSVTYGFHFYRDGEELAVGEMTSVCCRLIEGAKPEPIPNPDDVARAAEAARGLAPGAVVAPVVRADNRDHVGTPGQRNSQELPHARRAVGGARRR